MFFEYYHLDLNYFKLIITMDYKYGSTLILLHVEAFPQYYLLKGCSFISCMFFHIYQKLIFQLVLIIQHLVYPNLVIQ